MNEKLCKHCQKTFYEEYLTKIKYCNDCIEDIINKRPELYELLVECGLINEWQQKIFKAIKTYPESTDRELQNKTGFDINIITGRRNDLVNACLVESVGKRECSVKKTNVNIWALKDQLDLNKVREFKQIKEK